MKRRWQHGRPRVNAYQSDPSTRVRRSRRERVRRAVGAGASLLMRGRPDVFDGVIAVISGRAARRLYYWAHLDELAAKIGGQDAELDQALETLRVAGERWARAASGTQTAPAAEPVREWVSTKEAAEMLGMTARGVRKACDENRLAADASSGAWRIHREAIAHFKATRENR